MVRDGACSFALFLRILGRRSGVPEAGATVPLCFSPGGRSGVVALWSLSCKGRRVCALRRGRCCARVESRIWPLLCGSRKPRLGCRPEEGPPAWVYGPSASRRRAQVCRVSCAPRRRETARGRCTVESGSLAWGLRSRRGSPGTMCPCTGAVAAAPLRVGGMPGEAGRMGEAAWRRRVRGKRLGLQRGCSRTQQRTFLFAIARRRANAACAHPLRWGKRETHSPHHHARKPSAPYGADGGFSVILPVRIGRRRHRPGEAGAVRVPSGAARPGLRV